MAANTTVFEYKTDNYINSYDFNALADNGGGLAFDSTADRSITTYSFPHDLHRNPGRSAHVMQININENKTVSLGGAFSGLTSTITNIPGQIVNQLSPSTNGSGNPDNQINSSGLTSIATGFGTKRMKGAIFLYMPATVVFTNMNNYADISLTDLAINAGKSVLNATGRVIPGMGVVAAGLDATTDIGQTAAALGGLPINPKVEILFSNTPQRSFQFDFLFAPTSRDETNDLYNIIKTIRREAAPKAVDLVFWQAPSTFSISFLHNGKENTSIPKVQEAVLEQIDTDFAPSGVWSTFSNGYPTQVRMQLRFREKAPNDRDKIDQGY